MIRTRQIYFELTDARTQIEREGDTYELVWGYWSLRWLHKGATVDHPLIISAVDIDYDDKSGHTTLRFAGPGQLDVDCVADLDGIREGRRLSGFRSADLRATSEPWLHDKAAEDIERVLLTLHRDGQVADVAAAPSEEPRATGNWEIFVRRRPTNYRGFLDDMEEQIQSGGSISAPLASIVVDEPSALPIDRAPSWMGPAGSFLLPKPTNDEQMRILESAIRKNGVVAQGPPGTGKSHTIANLVSHFVASGKRVLVTAKKESALSVLSDKIPEQVRDLCVPVFGNDAQSQAVITSSINAIFEQVGSHDPVRSEREINRLRDDITEIKRQIALAESKLREISRFEGTVPAGETDLPGTLAGWLRDEVDRLGFIPDALPFDAMAPLSVPEFVELLEAARALDGNDVAAAIGLRPSGVDCLHPDQFARALATIDAASTAIDSHLDLLTRPEALDALDDTDTTWTTSHIREHADQVANARTPWTTKVIEQLDQGIDSDLWTGFIDLVEAEIDELLTIGTRLQGHPVELPDDGALSTNEIAVLNKALERLDQGKSLSRLTNRDASKLLDQARVGPEIPTTAEQVRFVLDESRRRSLRDVLAFRWNEQVGRVGGRTIEGHAEPEWILTQDVIQLRDTLDWAVSADEWRQFLTALGLAVEGRADSDLLHRCADAVEAGSQRRQLLAAEATITEATTELESKRGTALGDATIHALMARDLAKYTAQHQEIERLDHLTPAAHRYEELNGRLHAVTPRWASTIRSSRGDESTCGTPDLLAHAWRWRRLESWLRDAHEAVTVETVQQTIDDHRARLLRTTADLVGASAWHSLVDGFTDRDRQALSAWMNANQKYGKGKGKYASRWEVAAREALNDAQHAVPVWIMSVPNVLRSFRPGSHPPFDVIIIDEASQCGLLDLPVFALGQKVIVVGDGKQTSPENIGLNLGPVNELIEEHLHDLPNRKTVFDINSSLYAIAEQKFSDVIMLKEHFRCLPDIIRWSSEQFYGGRIVCLRDRNPAPGWQAVDAIHVPGGYIEKAQATNQGEADVIVAEIAKAVADPRYDGMDIGVVTLRSGGQAKLIHSMLIDELGSSTLAERNIRCGEPADFQGDERDLVFLSVVATKDPVTGGRIGAMTKGSDERRINVAASRARNKMVVVYSCDPEDLPRGDLRTSLLEHCTNPSHIDDVADGAFERCDSQFERDVLRHIINRGYERVIVQHPVGRYRLDLVVEGPDSRLAIECDGDRWHGEDKWDEDRARQQVLERAGWTFFRVRGSAFYRDPERSLEPLWSQLEELDIPAGNWAKDLPRPTVRATVAEPPPPETPDTPTSTPTTARTTVETRAPTAPAPTTPADAPKVLTSIATAIATRVSEQASANDPGTPANDEEPARTTPTPAAGLGPDPTPPDHPESGPRAREPKPLDRLTTSQDLLALLPEDLGSSDDPTDVPSPAIEDPKSGAADQRAATRSESNAEIADTETDRARHTTNPGSLRPYTSWKARGLKPIESYGSAGLARELLAVAEAEGPVVLRRAYRLVHQATGGGTQPSKTAKTKFNKAVALAVRRKDLAFVEFEPPGYIDRTVVIPGQPLVVVRELGDRNLLEIPRNEIRAGGINR